MNLKRVQYAIQLSKNLNYSQAAEELGISQPALSKQIILLEKELGVQLFERSTPLRLTPAGEHFLKEAEEILFREKQLASAMKDFQNEERGRLSIGISQFRALYMIPALIKKLSIRYPEIQIRLEEIGRESLRKEAAEGKYDFAIINLPVDETLFDIQSIAPDSLVLAVPNEMVSLVKHQEGEVSEVDLSDCRSLPFVAVNPTQELRQLFDNLCIKANIKPNIVMEVMYITTAWAMCRAGIGAALLPYQFFNDNGFDDRVTLLKFKNSSSYRQPAIVTRKGQYLSPYAKYAIELLTEKE